MGRWRGEKRRGTIRVGSLSSDHARGQVSQVTQPPLLSPPSYLKPSPAMISLSSSATMKK